MKLRFLCVDGFLRHTLRNAKHEPLRGSRGMHAPQKIYALRLNLVLPKAQNCYAKYKLWKSDVRKISLAVHANYKYLVGVNKSSP